MSCDIGKATEGLENELWHSWSDGKVGEWAELIDIEIDIQQSSFSNLSITSPTSQLILQPFRCFTYVTAHSSTLPLVYLRYSSFSNPSVVLPTSQLILQPFRRFTSVTAHSPTLPLLYLRHSSLSNPAVALPTSQLILQPFRCFTYVTAHSPTLPLLYLRHTSFWYPSVALPTSHLIPQPFRCFTTSQFILQPFFLFSYVTSSSLNSPGDPSMFVLYIKWIVYYVNNFLHQIPNLLILIGYCYVYSMYNQCFFFLKKFKGYSRLRLIKTSPPYNYVL